MRVLFIGDIIGRPGRKLLSRVLPELKHHYGPFDFCIANGENSAGGFGITKKIADELFGLGIDCLTSGNHIWDKRESYGVLQEESRLLRPANYPPGCPGGGWTTLERFGKRLAVCNLQGRVFMPATDCPFREADRLLERTEERCILVDFHAEATSEKIAMARYLDGRASAVVGTHTHVRTDDAEVLPGGTAMITDVGMTGGHGGVIGMEPEGPLSRFLSGMPAKFEVERHDLRLQGVVVDIDDETGRAMEITGITRRGEDGG
ncbi:MAG: TIGR00282 family metallophosphoesterase [Synergistales bacterium]|nr:TIGR00282 family metallophosphoesterase [Synergistales bacterium]